MSALLGLSHCGETQKGRERDPLAVDRAKGWL